MSEAKFWRAVQILRDEARFLEDYPDQAEGGEDSVPRRVKELREAADILEATNDAPEFKD